MEKLKPIKVLAAEVIEKLKRLNYAYNSICGFRSSFNRICAFARERNQLYFSEELGKEYLSKRYGCSVDYYLEAFPQKAKGAIRAAIDTLLARLGLQASDLQRLILTGSFGGQVDIAAAVELGMLPPAPREVIESVANGAGLGAAMFLSDEGFALGEVLAARAEQVDLDMDAGFTNRYIHSMQLS